MIKSVEYKNRKQMAWGWERETVSLKSDSSCPYNHEGKSYNRNTDDHENLDCWNAERLQKRSRNANSPDIKKASQNMNPLKRSLLIPSWSKTSLMPFQRNVICLQARRVGQRSQENLAIRETSNVWKIEIAECKSLWKLEKVVSIGQ